MPFFKFGPCKIALTALTMQPYSAEIRSLPDLVKPQENKHLWRPDDVVGLSASSSLRLHGMLSL